MRIIAGSAKGQKLKTPKGFQITRPAMAKVRESIVSSVQPFENKTILDLFAGTGSLGLECLSRGVKNCSFVDNNRQAVSLIKQNLQKLGFEQHAQVFFKTLPYGLKSLQTEEPFDIVFCDPPYQKNLIDKTLQVLVDYKLIDPQSLIIVEHNSKEVPDLTNFVQIKQKKFGQTLISYLQMKEPIS